MTTYICFKIQNVGIEKIKKCIFFKALNHVVGDGGVGISALHFDSSEVFLYSSLFYDESRRNLYNQNV